MNKSSSIYTGHSSITLLFDFVINQSSSKLLVKNVLSILAMTNSRINVNVTSM